MRDIHNLFSGERYRSLAMLMAERADIGERVPPAQHDVYHIKAPPGSSWRLILLPSALMITGVLVLGLGVWVVRRR